VPLEQASENLIQKKYKKKLKITKNLSKESEFGKNIKKSQEQGYQPNKAVHTSVAYYVHRTVDICQKFLPSSPPTTTTTFTTTHPPRPSPPQKCPGSANQNT
jgi:hypothetical protein